MRGERSNGSDTYDAIVVGAGFAGATAARELRAKGHDVLVLEARDRIGGRTWWSKFGDLDVELGGTWVHWLQPHVWAEITRYGTALKESPRGERAVWLVDGERREGTADDFAAILGPAIERFYDDARAVFERPMSPLHDEDAVRAVDRLSARDRLDGLELDAAQRAILGGLVSTICSAPASEGGLAAVLHWYALAGWDFGLMFDSLGRYKFADGTKRLIEAILADARADVRLSAPVAGVEHRSDGVVVTTRSGDAYSAAAAVLAVPLNTLGAIRFAPELSAGKREAAAAGQASRGLKVWVRVRGELDHVVAQGPEEHALTSLHVELRLPGESVLIGFGPDASRLDVNDLEAVTAAVHEYLPDVEVLACCGHDWVADEFSRSTWPILRPGQMTELLRELQRPEGRVLVAGSDVADGWNGFIDGAIESGLRAGREASALIRPA